MSSTNAQTIDTLMKQVRDEVDRSDQGAGVVSSLRLLVRDLSNSNAAVVDRSGMCRISVGSAFTREDTTMRGVSVLDPGNTHVVLYVDISKARHRAGDYSEAGAAFRAWGRKHPGWTEVTETDRQPWSMRSHLFPDGYCVIAGSVFVDIDQPDGPDGEEEEDEEADESDEEEDSENEE